MKIEKGIPIPSRKARADDRLLIDKMEVGDSILVESWKSVEKFRYTGRNAGFKMSVRKLGSGWRLWRIG